MVAPAAIPRSTGRLLGVAKEGAVLAGPAEVLGVLAVSPYSATSTSTAIPALMALRSSAERVALPITYWAELAAPAGAKPPAAPLVQAVAGLELTAEGAGHAAS